MNSSKLSILINLKIPERIKTEARLSRRVNFIILKKGISKKCLLIKIKVEN